MDQSKLNSLKPATAVALPLLERAAIEPGDALMSLAQLYRAYIQTWARGQISPALRSRFQSSTVVQETLIRIQRQAPDFECRSLPEFENYLLKSAYAVIADLRRRHLADRRSLLREVALEELESQVFWDAMRKASEQSPADLAARQDDQQDLLSRVRLALLSLKLHHQKVIHEHFLLGKSIAEIADDIGRSPNATRMLIRRALEALRARLQGSGESHNE
jgi:RNA polymerase sigma factor (sigma-70 family)